MVYGDMVVSMVVFFKFRQVLKIGIPLNKGRVASLIYSRILFIYIQECFFIYIQEFFSYIFKNSFLYIYIFKNFHIIFSYPRP